MSASENPPAFPTPELRADDGIGIREGAPGMTLRDWLAGQALQGVLASGGGVIDAIARVSSAAINRRTPAEDLAEACYRYADAMLAERAKESRS